MRLGFGVWDATVFLGSGGIRDNFGGLDLMVELWRGNGWRGLNGRDLVRLIWDH